MAVVVRSGAETSVQMRQRYLVFTPPSLSIYTSKVLPSTLLAEVPVAEYQVGFKHFSEAAPNAVFLAPRDLNTDSAENVLWINVASADKQRSWVRALATKGKAKMAQWDSIRPTVEGTLFYEYLLAPPPPQDAKIRPVSQVSRFADVNEARKEKAIARAQEAEAAAKAKSRPISGDYDAPHASSSSARPGGSTQAGVSLSTVVRMKALAKKVPQSVKERSAAVRAWCKAIVRAKYPSGQTPLKAEFNLEKGAACGWLLFEIIAHYAKEPAPAHTIDAGNISTCLANVSLAREWMALLGIDVDGWSVDDVVGCSTRPLLRALTALADHYNVDITDPSSGYAARNIVDPNSSAPPSSSSSSSIAAKQKKRALRSSYTPDVQRATPSSGSGPPPKPTAPPKMREPIGWEPAVSSQQKESAGKLEAITLPWLGNVLASVGCTAPIALEVGDGLTTGVGLVFLLTLGIGSPLPPGLVRHPRNVRACLTNVSLAYDLAREVIGSAVVDTWPSPKDLATGCPIRKTLGVMLGSLVKHLRHKTIV